MSGSVDRRGFFRIVGASSAAAAAAAGCGRTTEAILPYVLPPEHLVPGVANWYATVCRECPAGCGVLARNREGRVVKLEGNPDHPVNRGALCARGQASILGTYDPDRLPGPRVRQGDALAPIPVAEAEQLLLERLAAARRKGTGRIAMITRLESGSLGRLMDDWLAALGGRARVAHEPFAHEALRAANRVTFGVDAIPHYAVEEARTLLSLGADYLETWLSPVGHAGGFRRMRALRDGHRGTAIHIEPRYSMTAANADEWVVSRPGTEGVVALALLRIVLEAGAGASLPARERDTLLGVARDVDVGATARQSGIAEATLRRIGETLVTDAPSLVLGGGVAVTGPGAVDGLVAVNLLNYALGSVGTTVRFGPNASVGQASRYADLLALTRAMAAGEIDVLIVKDADPVFTLPPKAGFVEGLAKVPFVVSLSSHLDETTARAHLLVPDLTPLESWGDFSPRVGVLGLMQPAMASVGPVAPRRQDVLDLAPLAPLQRLFGQAPPESFPGVETQATGDLLLATGRALVPGGDQGPFRAETFAAYLRGRWQELAKTAAPGVAFDTFWEEALRRGGVFTEPPPARVALQTGVRVAAPAALEGAADGLALMVVPSSRFYDGRGANKAWLHEAPDPITQIVYDAWVEVSSDAAGRLGIGPGDVVRVESPHGAVELAAFVSETLEPGTVAIPLGLGHAEYGRFAKGVGANPIQLLPGEADPASGGPRWLAVQVSLTRTGRRTRLATPAGVTEVDHRREIIETVALKDAAALDHGAAPPKHANLPSMYPDVKYPEHRWGMSVDLDACIGCQACVVACQAENNVPIVGLGEGTPPGAPLHFHDWPDGGVNPIARAGKDQISYGRSLHWLRVERWWDRGHGAPVPGGHAGVERGVAHAATAPGRGERPRARFVPMMCQHCEVAPCEPVCPVFAAYHTAEGLNGQVYNRCVGTRYCGNNCPYMARRFNWARYAWPGPMALVLNPDVTVRDRGVMEKCTMCVQRIIAGKDQPRSEERRVRDGEIRTACQQTCPTRAIVFGDLKDDASQVSSLSASARGYHVLGELGTRPAVTYLRKIVGDAHA